MAVNGVNDSAGYNFDSVASIRKQTEAIRQRAAAQREKRIAEQDRTGLIQDPKTGEMVELSSISEETRVEWNDRSEMGALSIGEVMLLFKDAGLNLETVEKSKELTKPATKLQNKMFSGKLLTGKEIRWLRENDYTWLAGAAERAVQEAEQLKTQLARCKSKEEAHQVYMNAKSRLMGGVDKNDGAIESYGATLIELSARHAPEASLLCTATTMTNGKKSLKERVTMIARRLRMTATVVCAVVLIAAVATGCTFAGAVTENEPPLGAGSEAGIPNSDGQGANGQGTQGTTSGSLNILTPEQKSQKIIDDLPGVPLSEKEIAEFNEMFTSIVQMETDYGITPLTTPVSCFFTSLYDDVTELDFLNFLWYHPTDGNLREEDAAEFEAISRHPDFHYKRPDKEVFTVDDLPVPTSRILRSSVDESLQTYAGTTTADLKNTENVIYLPEYDAYYVFTSDFGPGMFECEGGKRDGDTVRLWSGVYGYDGSRSILRRHRTKGVQNRARWCRIKPWTSR